MSLRAAMISLLLGCVLAFALPAGAGPDIKPVMQNVVLPPTPVSPAEGAVLRNFPRRLEMTWQSLPGRTFEVEVDCFGCRQPGQWDSSSGAPFAIKSIPGLSASMVFWGDNPGRWRVRAMHDGRVSIWSDWRNFRFQTSAAGRAVDLTVRIGNCPRAAVKPGQALGGTFTVTAFKGGGQAVSDVAVDIVLLRAARCPSPAAFAVYSPNFSDGVLLQGGREHISMGAAESTKPVPLNGSNAIPADTPPGSYFLAAVIDAGNKVAEADEGNNCAFCPLTVAAAEQPGQPCGVRLDRLSKPAGRPGDTFEMFGAWGSDPGTKLACINKGRMNRLEVLRWTPGVLLVRIPAGLEAGMYKVGVYCSDPGQGPTYSSGWLDFEIR